MDIWKYYDGDLKYPDIIDYFYDTNYGKQLSIHNSKIAYEFASTNGKFIEGEPEIAKDDHYLKRYTQEVLKKDFYLDGKLICKYEG